MKSFLIRPAEKSDHAGWSRMRRTLWPSIPKAKARHDLAEFLAKRGSFGLIAESEEGELIGFAELGPRDYVDGCDTSPVLHVEGIWVVERYRRKGVGAALIAEAEHAATVRGFRELSSDVELENRKSLKAHERWGFQETERIVYFRKRLRASRRRAT